MALVTHVIGDLFAAPRSSILVHACNAQGSWGGGIAVEFHARFPAAFKTYRAHCLAHDADALLGTCLLVPGAGDEHDVACLFTSRRYGARKDQPDAILRATETALQDLLRQNSENKELHACKFNSGKFGVPWSETEAIITRVGASMTVYTPPSQQAATAPVQSASNGSLPLAPPSRGRGGGRARGRGRGGRQMTLGAFGLISRNSRSVRGSQKNNPLPKSKAGTSTEQENDTPSS